MKINAEGIIRAVVGLVFMIAGAVIFYFLLSGSKMGMAFLFLLIFGALGASLFSLGILHFVRFRPPAKLPANHLELVLAAGGTKIDINHQLITAISNQYNILVNEQQSYSASTKLLAMLPEVHLFEANSNMPKYVMKKKWHYNNIVIKYDITTQNNNVLEFRTKNSWYGHYYCQAGQDYYEIFRHAGRKYSIYKNNVMIAFWDKLMVTLGEGDKFRIYTDKTCDHELLMSFCLIVDNHFSSQGKGKKAGLVNIDSGYSSEGAKPFDAEWRPKNS